MTCELQWEAGFPERSDSRWRLFSGYTKSDRADTVLEHATEFRMLLESAVKVFR